MAIKKTIQIGDKPVKLRASASVVRLYRDIFGRDVILDMNEIKKKVQSGEENDGTIFNVTENLTYTLAKAADPRGVPDDFYQWLDQFDPFALYACCEEVMTFWQENEKTLSKPKKKAAQQPAK